MSGAATSNETDPANGDWRELPDASLNWLIEEIEVLLRGMEHNVYARFNAAIA